MLQIFSNLQTVVLLDPESSLELHKLALTNEQNLESKELDLSARFPNY